MKRKTGLKYSAPSALALLALIFPAAAHAQAVEIDEVITTAQRTSQNVQDVPIAVTVLNTEALELNQVQDILDLQSQIPNINIATNTGTASAARIFLRGVGEDESRGAVDQAVGIYVDGVYIGRSVGSLMDVVDLSQIEVLRGPQGTLYGRNTIGGAIKLSAVKPQFENSGDVRATLGNNGRYDLRGTGNFALGERTAVRVTGLLRERDGFHSVIPNGLAADQRRDDVGGLHVFSARASLLHEFNDDWSVQFTADRTLDRSDPIPDSVAPGNDADGDIFTIEPLPGATCAAPFTAIGCFTGYNSRVQTGGVSLKIDGRFGDMDFNSTTAFRQMEDELATRIGLTFNQETDQEQFSQEFTLGQTGGSALDWLVGLYIWSEDLNLDSVFAFPFTLASTTSSAALFGQGTYAINDQIALTAGLRVTQESKEFDGANLAPFPPFNGFRRSDEKDFDNISYTIGADYKLNDDTLLYGKYSTGFKSGGWSPDAFSGTAIFLPVDEETLGSFEVGVKADLMSNLRVNAAAFFNQYEGLQIAATVPGLGFTRFNVDETEIKGVEAEATWQLTDAFQINGNIGLLDAQYTQLTEGQARALTGNNQFNVCGTGGAGAIATAAQAINCGLGLELKNAPEFKFTLGGLYQTDIYNGDLAISGNISREGESWSLVANSPAHARIEDLTLVNARIAYNDDAGWSAALWGKNIGDEQYYRATSAGSFTTYASEPITYGVDLGYKF